MSREIADSLCWGDDSRAPEAEGPEGSRARATQSLRAARYRREIDRRIIEGYLQDPPSMIEELGRAGIAKEEIARRGAVLGVTAAVLQLRNPDRSGLAARQCLCCDQAFLSLGIHNRLCRRCRGRG